MFFAVIEGLQNYQIVNTTHLPVHLTEATPPCTTEASVSMENPSLSQPVTPLSKPGLVSSSCDDSTVGAAHSRAQSTHTTNMAECAGECLIYTLTAHL